jgi:hypothetical protein
MRLASPRSGVALALAASLALLACGGEGAFYDFVHVVAERGDGPYVSEAGALDEDAIERGRVALRDMPDAPSWALARENCDETEIASGRGVGVDGTEIDLLGFVGRGDALVAAQPVPMRIRPMSNYHCSCR